MCECGGELTDCVCGGDLCDDCGCWTCRDDYRGDDPSDRGCLDCGSYTCGGYPNCPPDDPPDSED